MLTGTGAGSFITVDTETKAQELASNVPEPWQAYAVKGMNRSPLLESIEKFDNGV
jgi:4-diphosphocytidyl-2-C-methyl-D-erythritol kinase